MNKPMPVIDLFAGPGGLGEGFSSIVGESGKRFFDVRLSVEKDPVAHRTLTLRALFRSFGVGNVPEEYYRYVRGEINTATLWNNPVFKENAIHARSEAMCATLGLPAEEEEIDRRIRQGIGDSENWVLIGGPPCQAYSLAGRSKLRGTDPDKYATDHRHTLYREYLRIIRKFRPAVFVMENVKGILSSNFEGKPVFDMIRQDLSRPGEGLEYEIRSFVTDAVGKDLQPGDFIIKSEMYGIPQMRHRVILFGIRKDLAKIGHGHLKPVSVPATVREVISSMPKIRSRISRETDTSGKWHAVLEKAEPKLEKISGPFASVVAAAIRQSRHVSESGDAFVPCSGSSQEIGNQDLAKWMQDRKIGGLLQHQARSHMASDLHRYLFASCHAFVAGASPTLADYPSWLLPAHKNIHGKKEIPFCDRFKVQVWGKPSTTVVSHICKDGHYYIHPDPAQCRSLTVREAARLQTFPDNYFFEGNRTQQYHQVGNAVPPFLARKIAEVVADFLTRSGVSG